MDALRVDALRAQGVGDLSRLRAHSLLFPVSHQLAPAPNVEIAYRGRHLESPLTCHAPDG